MTKWQRVKFQPNLSLGKDGQKVTACKAHRDLSKEAAKEGMVLLKNDDQLLPLSTGAKVALFGKGSFDYVKGGGGSGDVTVEYIMNLYEGFKALNDKISVYEELSEYYRDYVTKQYANGTEPGMVIEPSLTETMVQKAKSFTDTAIITISRFSGEGWDRSSHLSGVNESLTGADAAFAEKSNKIFENGDFYLSNSETKMVEKVKKHFSKIIIVMNVGGMVDSQWFANDKSIQSVLMAWQGGMEGGLAIAELLCGIGNPSGKLADTFAKGLEDYPSTDNFHESEDYVDYTDDIYVGYRYFETMNAGKERVNYPFGYGLSYTTFNYKVMETIVEEENIHIAVQVVNTGNLAGKEVIQVYVRAPQGHLGKSAMSLVAFKKTRLLQSGDLQLLHFNINPSDFASYDDLGKLCASAYVLEAGNYDFYIGNSVRRTTKADLSYVLKQNRVVQQLTRKIAPTGLAKRMLADGTYETLTMGESNDPNASILQPLTFDETDGTAPIALERDFYSIFDGPFKEQYTCLVDVATGKASLEDFMAQLSDKELAYLLGGQPNTGVANTFGFGNLAKYGVPNIMTADGPAGLRIEGQCGVNTTAWPCSTLLACSWNEDMVYAVGEAGAKEVKENNIAVWLTPAVNIHRSPLCGRNFEYYSEDPYLTGKLASAMVKGIQSQHIAASVKHFAFNNKETNRKNSDSRVSERAAREIYLKAFEIIVKEAQPWTIMTAYNIVNGHRASENRELLQGILRDEWGFEGLVTSDWWTRGEHYKETKAGNDVKMASGYPERLLQAIDQGALTREDMEISAKRVLNLILKID